MIIDNTSFFTSKEFINVYGEKYSDKIKNALIVKDKELFSLYRNTELIKLETDGKIISVGEKLLTDLLTNDYLYNYVINNIDNKDGVVVKLCYFNPITELIDTIGITKVELSKLYELVDKSKIKNQTLINVLNIKTSFRQLLKDYKGRKVNYQVGNEKITKNVEDLLNIIDLNEIDFNEMKKDSFGKLLFTILNDFIIKEKIMDKYKFTEEQFNNINDIKENKYYRDVIDLDEYINNLINKVDLTDDMIDKLFKYSKNDYSKLEIAIHSYIMLHKNLTDENKMYKDFIIIYAALLRKIGITFELLEPDNVLDDFDSLQFVTDEYLITASSKKEDMETISGLKCIGASQFQQTKFSEVLYKVSTNIIKQENSKKTFEDASKRYQITKTISDEEKIKDLLFAIIKSDLDKNTSIEYQKVLLNKLSNKVKYTFVKDNNSNMVTLLLIHDDVEKYYYIENSSENKKILPTTKDRIYQFLRDGRYTSIPEYDLEKIKVIDEGAARAIR